VKANVQPKSSIPIGAKVKINAKGFTFGVKSEIGKKKLFNPPQVLINAELYGIELAQGRLKDTIKFGRPICNTWGQCSSIN
jgi:hypothetical protein